MCTARLKPGTASTRGADAEELGRTTLVAPHGYLHDGPGVGRAQPDQIGGERREPTHQRPQRRAAPSRPVRGRQTDTGTARFRLSARSPRHRPARGVVGSAQPGALATVHGAEAAVAVAVGRAQQAAAEPDVRRARDPTARDAPARIARAESHGVTQIRARALDEAVVAPEDDTHNAAAAWARAPAGQSLVSATAVADATARDAQERRGTGAAAARWIDLVAQLHSTANA